jgi:hypothetical protein
MRIIDESLIPTGDAIYFKQGTWTHLQKAYKEAIDAIVHPLIGSTYDSTKYYLLYGCVATGTDPGARTISAGAIFYNGEIYLVPAASFTTTGADVPVGNITVTNNTTDYSVDPQVTPGGNTVYVHKIRTNVFTAGASNSGDVDFSDLVNVVVGHNSYTTLPAVSLGSGFSYVTSYDGGGRLYEDGTVVYSTWVEWTGNKAYDTTILTGLPSVSGFNRIIPVIIGSPVGSAFVKLYTNGSIKVFTALTSPVDNMIISVIYKKE